MARILPFPLARRVGYIRKQAAWLSEQRRSAAEINLERQIQVQRDALCRRGVDPIVIDAECRSLEAAIRAQMTRFRLIPGGAA